MKRRILPVLCTLVFALSLLCFGVAAQTFAPDTDGLYSVDLSLEANNEYILFVLKGEYDQTNYIEAFNAANDSDILYFEQKLSDAQGTVSFGPFAPNGYYDATLVVGGTNLDEPYLAGYLSAAGVSNAASVKILGVDERYVVKGIGTENHTAKIETEVFDSFGYPSMTNEEVTLSLVNNADGVYLEENTLVIENTAKAQAFSVVASTDSDTETVYVVIEREAPKASYIEVYDDASMTESLDAVRVVGAQENYPALTVYAKTFDQYGEEFADTHTFIYGGQNVSSTFIPNVGTVEMTVKSTVSSVEKNVNIVAVARPDYKDSALELFNLVESAKALFAEPKNISAESGKDIFPEENWTTQAAVNTFETAIDTAEAALEKYGSSGYLDSGYSDEVSDLTRAINTYNDSFKAGKRVDVDSIEIEEADVLVAIGTDVELTATTSPRITMTTDKLTWTSSNDTIATVDADGNVTGKTSGTVTITATTRGGLCASTTVTFVKAATKLELTPTKASAQYGSDAVVLTAKIFGTDSTDIVEWSVDKPAVLDLSFTEYISETGHRQVDATIIPKSAGTAKVTATAKFGNKTATSTVTVTMPAWETAKAPTSNVKSGPVLANTEVVLTSDTENATIYYTLDGTTPSKTNGRVYKNPIVLTKSLTLRAVAVCEDMYDSAVSEYSYDVVDSSISISSALGKTGSTVELFVSGTAFENVNKSYITLKYDTDALEILGTTELEGLDVAYYEDTVSIIYTKSDIEFSGGRYAKILFKIADDAPEGEYDIILSDGRIEALLDTEEGGVTEFNAVLFSGVITVKNYLPGDANGDGIVGLGDVLIIKQYLDGNETAKENIILDAADVSGDGRVGRNDLNLLSRYCVGWDVTLG